MKGFIDLHLRPNLEERAEIRRIIERSAELGYKAIGVSLPQEKLQEGVREIRKICSDVGIDFISRIDLEPRDSAELLRSLRFLRRRVEVIAVKCLSKSVARQAAKDRRVDILSFSPIDLRRRFFDSAEAELASRTQVSLEFDMAPLLYLHGNQRINLLWKMRIETIIAKKFDVPIVLSSGVSEAWLLRKPEDYASLGYLFGLDFENAKKAISENPKRIVERNRMKLSPNYVAPGIYVVRRGKDCPK